jgi:hypothetical protein
MAVGPTDRVTDPRWPKFLSLTAHELRSPLSVVSGYIGWLLKEHAGPVSDQQRKWLEEASKSCGRLTALLAEVSEVSQLEAGTAKFNRGRIELPRLLAEVIAAVPPTDPPITIELRAGGAAAVLGDPVRLRNAFSSILVALRRELVTSDHMVVALKRETGNGPALIRITIADAERIDALATQAPADLATFDEWRGGVGLSLPTARRILEAHDGLILAPADDGKASAVISIPAV